MCHFVVAAVLVVVVAAVVLFFLFFAYFFPFFQRNKVNLTHVIDDFIFTFSFSLSPA